MKKFDIVAVVDTYKDKSGATKKRYKNVGSLMENDKGQYILLDRSFNPAGIPNPDNKGNITLSLFAVNKGGNNPTAPTPDFNDEIPF